MLSLVVARGRNGAIGLGGAIPWHAPEDLAFFQRETLGGALIMGRRTWESLPRRPLPRRHNIVVSSTALEGPQAVVASIDAALAEAQRAGHARVYGVGGARIYAALMPLAERLVVTEVEIDIAGADTFFPEFDLREWALVGSFPLREVPPVCVAHEYLRRPLVPAPGRE
ncbi:dihydrofolate reductase [Rhodobacteraceae bacterium 2376]|uniref:Dihydrofolate reductase n=1 Tax=Rhabdonatronobacter sediminivivens TaxID=2743469 RepID=A0A7Z0KYN5_9RHOB|nr:dihydrofolate reductase [Rhabdonatronobacter sediminivivens]NYS24666.1 dihydrofolate reductase [Rhabdonatronobacter sediminivivens]